MARLAQVIHVDSRAALQQCALFDSASDIPAPATARPFGLDGAVIYGAVIDTTIVTDDGRWLLEKSGTPLEFIPTEGLNIGMTLLTTPYYIRPLADGVTLPARGNTDSPGAAADTWVALASLVSTNGAFSSFSCGNPGVTVAAAAAALGEEPTYYLGCLTDNGTGEDLASDLTLTYSFADGTAQSVTLTCRQLGVGVFVAYIGGGGAAALARPSEWSSGLGEAQGVVVADLERSVLVSPDGMSGRWAPAYLDVGGVEEFDDESMAREDFAGRSNTAAEAEACEDRDMRDEADIRPVSEFEV